MAVTIGKIRGLQQVSTPEGFFTILACDQRGAMERMMKAAGRTVSHASVVQMKIDIVKPLAGKASGVLLDPDYAAAHLIAANAVPGQTGLVVSLEQTGYAERDGDRLTQLLENWGVDKIKAMGASAVKLLVYYNPRREGAAKHQRRIVAEVADQCQAYDIPFMLEPLAYPTVEGDTEGFAKEKPDLVVETAAHMSEYAVDLLKMEFPVHPSVDDKEVWREQCRRLNEACRVPWALLSAGVSFEKYAEQLQIACEAGASGFVAGRAIWREAIELPEGDERQAFLSETMPGRLQKLVDIAAASGTPWHQRPSHAYSLGDVPEDWYARYPGLRR